MISLVSVFIVQIGIDDEYILKFNKHVTLTAKFQIRKIIQASCGVISTLVDNVIIPRKCLPILKMTLDMEAIRFFVLSEEEYANLETGSDENNILDKSFKAARYDTPDTVHPNETFGGKVLVVRVYRETGLIKMSKYDAPLIEFIKSLKKEHRKYDAETHNWTISDNTTFNHFLTHVRQIPALVLEMN